MSTDNACPECGRPVQVWADRSGGVTVNFACDNAACASGKGPWDTERPRCLNEGPDCAGPVAYRYTGRADGKSWPRCDFHHARRIEQASDPSSLEYWADSDAPPPWFDPTYAGERWNEDE